MFAFQISLLIKVYLKLLGIPLSFIPIYSRTYFRKKGELNDYRATKVACRSSAGLIAESVSVSPHVLAILNSEQESRISMRTVYSNKKYDANTLLSFA